MPQFKVSVWCDEEFVAREDGYLIPKGQDESTIQPLFLHSTEFLLKELYPSMEMESILKHQGYLVETENGEDATKDSTEAMDVDEPAADDSSVAMEAAEDDPPEANNDSNATKGRKKKKATIPARYQVYQQLVRRENLANRVQTALNDIQRCRNFEGKKKRDGDRGYNRREKAKVRALEHQQERLLSQQQSRESQGDTGDELQSQETDDDGTAAANEGDAEEPPSVRMVRTLNSIRALYPHLLPMLNHPRRKAKDLVIKETQWKSKNKKEMSWMIGAKVYDTSTNKLATVALKDATLILEGYISVAKARSIASDSHGLPEYWSKSWLLDVRERANPPILNPLQILSEHQDKDSIVGNARRCDKRLLDSDLKDQSGTIQKKYLSAVHNVRGRISKLMTNRFAGARVSVYGSCLSELSLGKGADVDLSLWFPAASNLQTDFQEGRVDATTYERQMKQYVYQAFRKLANLRPEFTDLQPITRTRVPVIKGTFKFANNPHSDDGSIKFDICFLNDIAVANSGLLRQYSLISPKIRTLMMTVKRWAKDHGINSAADNFLSSYAWMNLVVFYLQCLGLVPNLQSQELMEAVGVTPQPDSNYWHFVNRLDTCTPTWAQIQEAKAWSEPTELADTPASALLYGFYEFYSHRFPSAIVATSIKKADFSTPKLACKKTSLFYCIEDPFETFDSHCPHDLGLPVQEGGSRTIMQYLAQAESHLREVLLGNNDGVELWPAPPISHKQQIGAKKKDDGARRGAQQGGKKDTPKPINHKSKDGQNARAIDGRDNRMQESAGSKQAQDAQQAEKRIAGKNRGPANHGGRGRQWRKKKQAEKQPTHQNDAGGQNGGEGRGNASRNQRRPGRGNARRRKPKPSQANAQSEGGSKPEQV